MKININLELDTQEDFNKALTLYKSLKYSTGKKSVNLEELSEIIKKVDLLSNIEEVKKFMAYK